ncbi:MAG: hypothetical protein ACP5QA_05485 [Phycisphaerae bacterium]
MPTAAGKTACIDIAVFALACQAHLPPEKRTAPRRIFFVVDRRIVVDQAYQHAKDLASLLADSKTDMLKRVADILRTFAMNERPLDVYALRGGMYRESAWVRSPLQPTIITSTVDQVGSRLLFRGYGVSDSLKPIHAGLVGNDALILLDEAHCARPFEQTMNAVSKYRSWAEEPLPSPFRLVSMTATPSSDMPDTEIERDREDDRAHPVLGARIKASKPARLVVASSATRTKWRPELVKELAKQAKALQKDGFRAIGVIVNRVATARDTADALRCEGVNVVLLTGRMRPSESLPVRLDVFKHWLANKDMADESSDLEGEPTSASNDEEKEPKSPRRALRWNGPDSNETRVIHQLGNQPIGLYVVPIDADSNLQYLGDFPDSLPGDQGDEAFQKARDLAILRLTPTIFNMQSLTKPTADDDNSQEQKITEITRSLRNDPREWVQRAAKSLENKSNRVVRPHPLGGLVVTGKKRLRKFDPTFIEAEESWESASSRPYPLTDHCRDVADIACKFAAQSGLTWHKDAFYPAGLSRSKDSGRHTTAAQSELRTCNACLVAMRNHHRGRTPLRIGRSGGGGCGITPTLPTA